MKTEGVAHSSVWGRAMARSRNLLRRFFRGSREIHDREAMQEAESLLEKSGQKFTDETEREMMERFTRNRSFRP
jgi:hypothetical protein